MATKNMTYPQVLDWIYNALPMFQNIGAGAYKPGLEATLSLMAHVGNPHQGLSCVHIAGTNGKGSVSNLLASVLMEAGYSVGLYTSPHLVDFRERIRVDGQMVEEEYVRDFVCRNFDFFTENSFSFFEMTTAMAFSYFRDKNVDIAVVETGLGGRLDCTNVVTPMLSIVTNIALDHTAFLGNTRREIASEKAGIIKEGVPVLIGESDEEILPVFASVARDMGAELYTTALKKERYDCPLKGDYQRFNISTVVRAYELLKERLSLEEEHLWLGMKNVVSNTHFYGRWQCLSDSPLTICDTGHNVNGVTEIVRQLESIPKKRLHMIFGMVGDKDIDGVLALLPADAEYYFTASSVKRSLGGEELAEKAKAHSLCGEVYPTVAKAIDAAIGRADKDDVIFIGGSTFVVADALQHIKHR